MTSDLSSVAREAAEKSGHYPETMLGHRQLQRAYALGFTECASRLPSEEEFGAVVLKHFHGPDELHPSWWVNTEEMGAAIAALIGEKISG